MNSIRSHGAIPFYSWGSQSIPVPSNLSEPNFQLSDVIEGHHDAYIRKFAEAAKAWGHPFFLRFNWEMNGGWFAWAEGVNGNKAGEYVAAWRHVHDIFTQVGATNATWVWCPNVDPENQMQRPQLALPGRRLRRLDRARRLQLGHQPDPARPLAQLRLALQLDLQEDHRHDRPLEAADDQRGRLDRVRRLEGGLDQGHAGQDPDQLPEDPRPALVRASSTTAWTGRSRPRPAPPAPSPKASRTPPTPSNSFASLAGSGPVAGRQLAPRQRSGALSRAARTNVQSILQFLNRPASRADGECMPAAPTFRRTARALARRRRHRPAARRRSRQRQSPRAPAPAQPAQGEHAGIASARTLGGPSCNRLARALARARRLRPAAADRTPPRQALQPAAKAPVGRHRAALLGRLDRRPADRRRGALGHGRRHQVRRHGRQGRLDGQLLLPLRRLLLLALLLLQVPGGADGSDPRPRLDALLQLGLAVHPGQPRTSPTSSSPT